MGGLLGEAGDPAGLVGLHDPAGRRRSRSGRPPSVATALVLSVRLDQRPEVEVGEVVGVAGQEELLAGHPVPVGAADVPALPSSSGS